MRYMIDGNNLMHALGMVRSSMNPRNWESRQRDLLDWLSRYRHTLGEICVVFDSQSRFSTIGKYQGIEVLAACPPQKADTVIQILVEKNPRPHELIVVSNDVTVRTLGQKKNVKGLKVKEFLDWLEDKA
jgi:predicted RNA-binding protein with PIN domain